MKKLNRFSLAAAVLLIVATALIGYFIVHNGHGANADINSDGSVNIADLSILAAGYGKSGTFSQGDLNGDGKVNVSDLSILAANWGNGVSSSFVGVCGTQLCLNGHTFVIHGATAYGQYDNPSVEITRAKQGKLNVLELVEFDNQYHTLSDTMSEATWRRVDNFIATAKQNGIHVILNLSEYAQSLQASGQTATTTDWQPYLSFVANRTNTVNGQKYKNDSTIAMVKIWGEICPITPIQFATSKLIHRATSAAIPLAG
jgi:hypothetical protein